MVSAIDIQPCCNRGFTVVDVGLAFVIGSNWPGNNWEVPVDAEKAVHMIKKGD